MKKTFLLPIGFVLMFAANVFAQTPTPYRIDNFDINGAVKIQQPPPQPTRRPWRARKLTASGNLIYSPSDVQLTQLTAMNSSNSLDGFTTGDSAIDGFIVESGRRNSVDPLLLYSIMHQESTFQRQAVSPKGARGLMQLMPGTALRFGVRNIFDPRQNIEAGAKYMRFLLDQFDGDVPLALAGYNAGEGAVIKYGYNIPPYAETREYVRRITKRYALIRDPSAVQTANRLAPTQIATTQKPSAPLNTYERSVFAVRMPDGRLQLVSQ